MMAPTHTMLGVAALCGAAALQPEALQITAITVAAASLGSLAPDLDHPSSWLGKRLFFISLPLSGLIGHRGLTHSLLAGGIVTFGLGWYLQTGHVVPWMVAFFLGYISHLIGDWMTGGVPLLWPSKRRYRAPFAFQTGGIFERIFAISFATVMFYIGWRFFVEGGLGSIL